MRIICAMSVYEGDNMTYERKFSDGFIDDIQNLLEVCLENDKNSVDITIPFREVDLGIEINFFIRSGKVKVKE